ncbi:MAG TPA: nuclear transport factor 2 family protein [Candidatus Sulfotelmatobacter sp.]|nr:nuclear transport factor 2 family protein [Candidatus Sulfotelmatobacter sp.]
MARRWLLLGALLLCVLSVGCFSAGTLVAGKEAVGVTAQLNDSRATLSKDQQQLAIVTTQLNAERPMVDEYQVKQIEVTFHMALATKNLDLMMSIFDPNAVMTTPAGDVYRGAAAIRTFYATKSVAMQVQNHWAALVPAYRIKASIAEDTASLTFECHLVDIATSRMMLEHRIDMTATRRGSSWLVMTMKSTAITLS